MLAFGVDVAAPLTPRQVAEAVAAIAPDHAALAAMISRGAPHDDGYWQARERLLNDIAAGAEGARWWAMLALANADGAHPSLSVACDCAARAVALSLGPHWRKGLVRRALAELEVEPATRETTAWRVAFAWEASRPEDSYADRAVRSLALALLAGDDVAAERAARWVVDPGGAMGEALAGVPPC